MRFSTFFMTAVAAQAEFYELDIIITDMVGKDSQECHDEYSSESTCNADPDCAWCRCAAVPSGCFSEADAKTLPYPSFDCDVKEAVEIVEEKTSDQCKAQHSKESDCNADDECTWCKAAAVPSMCVNLEDGKALPYPSFDCAGVPHEEPLGKDSDECKATYSDKGSCDADADCTWCDCAAVPSMCLATEDAGGLPYPSFDCTGFH